MNVVLESLLVSSSILPCRIREMNVVLAPYESFPELVFTKYSADKEEISVSFMSLIFSFQTMMGVYYI